MVVLAASLVGWCLIQVSIWRSPCRWYLSTALFSLSRCQNTCRRPQHTQHISSKVRTTVSPVCSQLRRTENTEHPCGTNPSRWCGVPFVHAHRSKHRRLNEWCMGQVLQFWCRVLRICVSACQLRAGKLASCAARSGIVNVK